ncbi:hypothetical protein FDZ71_15610 [bacterium]|nr:MAG: hypothetical protein FDZ71_15610 [bacterium]
MSVSPQHVQAFPTFFAPGERIAPEEVSRAAKRASCDPVIRVVLQSVLGYVLILNKNRQILAGNEELLGLMGVKEKESLLGRRPGEALMCVHAKEGPSGCGTSRHCKACGAVLAILSALGTDQPAQGECHLCSEVGGKFHCAEFRVNATPINIAGEKCLVFVLVDISGQKRREALERIFIHDLRNSVTGLLGWGDLLETGSTEKAAKSMIQLSREIGLVLEEHAALMHAESGELCVSLAEVSVEEIFDTVSAALICTEAARGKR